MYKVCTPWVKKKKKNQKKLKGIGGGNKTRENSLLQVGKLGSEKKGEKKKL